jgi:hypothetical protein
MRGLLGIGLISITLLFGGCGGGDSTSASTASAPAVKYAGGGLAELRRLEGKRIREIELWDAPDIQERLGKLVGAEFEALKREWMIESPITVDGDVLMAAGCDWNNNCDQNQYVMFADTAKDNINILHFKDGKEKAYKEKGDVALTEKFTQDLAAMKAKCGVK